MPNYFPLCIIAILFGCIFIASMVLKIIPDRALTSFDSIRRNSPLDGLRGILALSVLAHHYFITYVWKTTGNWVKPEFEILNNLGALPVSLFFLITGYLFLNKIKTPELDWKKLYLSRFKRIMPLYYAVCLVIFLITLTSLQSDVSLKELGKWAYYWLTFRGGPLADFPSTKIIAGVNWTLF